VGVLLGGALSAAGFARVYLTSGSLINSTAIAVSVLGIVSTSCLLGSGLPFVLARAGVDPANAGTSIQVRLGCGCWLGLQACGLFVVHCREVKLGGAATS